MAYIDWNDGYSVKIVSIDEQHKKLFDMINIFYVSVKEGTHREKLIELVTGLKEYTEFHFTHEEKLMKDNGYTALSSHKAEHEKFVNKVREFLDKVESGKLIISVEVTNFLKDWLINHIKGTDQLYSSLLAGKGVR